VAQSCALASERACQREKARIEKVLDCWFSPTWLLVNERATRHRGWKTVPLSLTSLFDGPICGRAGGNPQKDNRNEKGKAKNQNQKQRKRKF